jgi:hypothetical protein
MVTANSKVKNPKREYGAWGTRRLKTEKARRDSSPDGGSE